MSAQPSAITGERPFWLRKKVIYFVKTVGRVSLMKLWMWVADAEPEDRKCGWRTAAKLQILSKPQNLVRNICINKRWVAAAQSRAFGLLDFLLAFLSMKKAENKCS